MHTLYLRTPHGNQEITERRHGLTRWQRATLIVVGTGKRLADLHREMRHMPEKLEHILHVLIEKGLVARDSSLAPLHSGSQAPEIDLMKDERRYLTYLIGIIDNSNASAALELTIKLKKASSREDIETLKPTLMAYLDTVCGEDESQRLLDKLAPAQTHARAFQ